MAKKVRFPLEMENGVEVRSMEELRNNFSLSRIIGYINDGRMVKWLRDRYENDVAEKVADGSIKVLFDIPESNIFGYAPDTVLKLSSQKIMKLGWNPKVNLEDAYHRLVRYIKGE